MVRRTGSAVVNPGRVSATPLQAVTAGGKAGQEEGAVRVCCQGDEGFVAAHRVKQELYPAGRRFIRSAGRFYF